MEYICIGRIVNTHALKGEVRLISDFEFKERVFKIDTEVFIGDTKSREVISSYRKHKQFDMITFKGIDNINDVLKYKGKQVYVNSNILNLQEDEILEDEYILYSIYDNEKLIGKISEYRNDNNNKIIKVNDKFIPYNKDFISKIDKENKIIYMHDIGVFL